MSNDFGYWLAGLIDGEGCFLIQARGESRTSISPSFRLCLRHDDSPIIERIIRVTGLGKIYVDQRAGHTSMVCWVVNKKTDVPALAELLWEYPLKTRKHADFVIWSRAAVLWGATAYNRDQEELSRLRTALLEQRKQQRESVHA